MRYRVVSSTSSLQTFDPPYPKLFNIACCARSACLISRNWLAMPPLNALRDATDFPMALRGPVDCAHGFQWRMSSDCRARRSGVQEVTMIRLQ